MINIRKRALRNSAVKKLSMMVFLLFIALCGFAQTTQPDKVIEDTLPVRGLSIAAPAPAGVEDFIKFINDEMSTRDINTLILRVDFNYEFESHPELRNSSALTKTQVKKIVAACKKANIKIIPQINLLGHQSWAGTLGKLLTVYPEFDETPGIKIPEEYKWPNDDGLYCKSYCPLHPEVHQVVFSLMDEICDAFETDAFHAGMDEVFYIAHPDCPRCSGRDPAGLFAGEVTTLRNHLAQKGRKLWIWGDRLIDGKTTGMGMWEASMNNTYRAVDMIPKDVVICDWHYERADKTPVYFAMKGLSVVTCPWRKPEVAAQQMADMYQFRKNATPKMRSGYLGIIETTWTPAEAFLKDFYSENGRSPEGYSVAETFKTLFPKKQ